MHFHTSSENRIDGLISPMEVHFVNEHISDDNISEIVALGLIIDVSKSGRHTLGFTDGLFNKPDQNITLDLSGLNKLSNGRNFSFLGGLTAPPFTIQFQWYLCTYLDYKFLQIKKEDFLTFQELFGNNKANDISTYNENRFVETKNYLSVMINGRK